jgi:polyhydroxyalkanoate synthesis regulator phasin
MNRKMLIAGLVGAITLGGTGLIALDGVGAVTGGTDTTAEADPATVAGEERVGPVQAALDQLVADGVLTTEQADKVGTALRDAMPPRPGGPGANGPGANGPGANGPGAGRPGRAPALDAAAEALGVEVGELRTELRDGGSIATVAAEHGVDVQTVIDAMVADAEEHLAQAVTDGKLTQEQADERRSDLVERITALVNGERPHSR